MSLINRIAMSESFCVLQQCVGVVNALMPDRRVLKGAAVVMAVGGTIGLVMYKSAAIAEIVRSHCPASVYTYAVTVCSSPIMPDYRRDFKELVLNNIKHNSPKTHSHPNAAVIRCQANTLMTMFANAIGRDNYSGSMSTSEQKRSMLGDRDYYHAKDLQMRPQASKFNRDRQVYRMTDVDYYVDMNRILDGRMTIIYTFVPKVAGGSTLDGTFSIGKDSVISMKVDGGAEYKHQLWDYETDHLLIDFWWGTVFYHVEQRELSFDRRVILLNPMRIVWGPLGWVLPGRRLERRVMNFGSCNLTKFQATHEGVTERFYSFSQVNSCISATISERVVESSGIRLARSKAPQISDAERLIKASRVGEASPAQDAVEAAVLVRVYDLAPQLLTLYVETPVITPTMQDNHSYQMTYPLITEDGHPSMRLVGYPFCDAGVAPVRSYNNDLACVEGRLNEPRNRVKTYSPIFEERFGEFVRFLIPDAIAGTGVPLDHDDRESRLKRPTQRALLDQVREWMFMDSKWSVKAFQKAEAYAKVTDPRNISTLPTEHNFRLGMFALAFTQNVLKGCHWYAFGKHPSETARMLHDKCAQCTIAVGGDASRQDGSLGLIHRRLHTTIMRRYFSPEYHEELLRLLAKEEHANAVTTTGVVYNTGTTTLSGSAITTNLNTPTPAFHAYCAFRYTKTPEEAWAALGLYGGDDSIDFDLDPQRLVNVAAQLGMQVNVDVMRCGEPVPFLGRVYLDPWTDVTCIADVPRQLKKLHLSSTPPTVPNEVALRRKAKGILVTDPNTPFISKWARFYLEATRNMDVEDSKWENVLRNDDSYYSKFEAPFAAPTDEELAYKVVAQMLQCDAGELREMESRFDTIWSVADIPSLGIKFNADTPVELDSVRGGELTTVPKRKHFQEKVKRNLATSKEIISKPLCRFPPGKCVNKICRFRHLTPGVSGKL